MPLGNVNVVLVIDENRRSSWNCFSAVYSGWRDTRQWAVCLPMQTPMQTGKIGRALSRLWTKLLMQGQSNGDESKLKFLFNYHVRRLRPTRLICNIINKLNTNMMSHAHRWSDLHIFILYLENYRLYCPAPPPPMKSQVYNCIAPRPPPWSHRHTTGFALFQRVSFTEAGDWSIAAFCLIMICQRSGA